MPHNPKTYGDVIQARIRELTARKFLQELSVRMLSEEIEKLKAHTYEA